MRHRKAGRKLGMDSAHRKLVFRNMITSLVMHETIRTTEARAKELRRFAERVVTIAKNAPSTAAIAKLSGDEAQTASAKRVHAIRRARRLLADDQSVERLFADVAPRFVDRPGGYTRVIKADIRPGDNAPMAIIEFVDVSEMVPADDDAAATPSAED